MGGRDNIHVQRSQWLDREGYYKAVREAGGPGPNCSFNFSGSTESEQILAATFGRNPAEAASAAAHEAFEEQRRRPHVFVRKLRARKTRPHFAELYGPTPSYVTVEEFAAQYAAAQFAVQFRLPLDTSVTVKWKSLGCTSDDEVKKELNAFLKCMRDWLRQRKIPVAWLYSHECGPVDGLHTHLQVYIPGRPECRRAFRKWAQDWVVRRYGGKRPRAMRVSGHLTECLNRHWRLFHYRMKGYDPQAVVVAAQNSAERRNLYLGDLIAYPWRNPGIMTIQPRHHWSDSLGPGCRSRGVPDGVDWPATAAKVAPDRSTLDADGMFDSALQEQVRKTVPPRYASFQSRYEASHRHVVYLYGLDFCRAVTRICYNTRTTPEPEEPSPEPCDLDTPDMKDWF